MAWPDWTTEVSPSLINQTHWAAASALSRTWVDEALAASAIAVDGDGKFRVTYSGAQNLDDITGTTEGDVVIVRADVTGAGGNLTIRNNAPGNIRCSRGVDIVLSSDEAWAIFIHIGSVLAGGFIYG